MTDRQDLRKTHTNQFEALEQNTMPALTTFRIHMDDGEVFDLVTETAEDARDAVKASRPNCRIRKIKDLKEGVKSCA